VVRRVSRPTFSGRSFAILANVAPVATAAASGYPVHGLLLLVGAAGACVVAIVLALLPRAHKLAFAPVACAGTVSLTLMRAHTGGAASAYSMLMLTAMPWLGVQASDRELLVGGEAVTSHQPAGRRAQSPNVAADDVGMSPWSSPLVDAPATVLVRTC
jgi:hypothetical protein